MEENCPDSRVESVNAEVLSNPRKWLGIARRAARLCTRDPVHEEEVAEHAWSILLYRALRSEETPVPHLAQWLKAVVVRVSSRGPRPHQRLGHRDLEVVDDHSRAQGLRLHWWRGQMEERMPEIQMALGPREGRVLQLAFQGESLKGISRRCELDATQVRRALRIIGRKARSLLRARRPEKNPRLICPEASPSPH